MGSYDRSNWFQLPILLVASIVVRYNSSRILGNSHPDITTSIATSKEELTWTLENPSPTCSTIPTG
jgi:hypothetical protein